MIACRFGTHFPGGPCCALMLAVVAASAALPCAPTALAQVSAESDDPAGIALPTTWLNTVPPTIESLRGKAVLLYFFEESCPKCKRNWPGLMSLAARYRDDPIAFVAVNSGTPAPMIQKYARSVRLNWPIMLDLDRSFERLADIGEISLQNIVQVCYLTADGELKRGQWSDVDGTIDRALEGASWKIDPVEIPDELRVAWRNIEFANYAAAARTVNKAVGARQRDIRSAANKLVDLVDLQGRADLDAAKAEAEKSAYRAYAQYGGIVEQYAGFSAAKEATAERRTLSRDPQLRKELVAIKAVDKQRALLESPRAAVRARAAAAIKKIIDQDPGSEAARIGRGLLP